MNTKQSALNITVATGMVLATALVPVSQAFAATTTPTKTAIPLTLSAPAPTATDALSITAIPPRLEMTGKPGETIQKTIKVRNASATTQYFQTTAQDFIIEGDGTTPVPVTEQVSDRFSLAKWITISPTQFSLRAGETQVLDVLIEIPKDALPGGHYAMVLHQPPLQAQTSDSSLVTTTQSGSGVAQRVGTLMYLTIAGPIHEEAFIRNVVVPSFAEYGPVPIRFTVENRSDTHIRPQSSVEIKDMFGRTMDKVKVDEKNVFPFTGREFEASFSQYWGIGRYSVEITVPYGSSGKVTNAVAYFWMLPYRLILAILIGASALAAMVIAIRRHLLHRNNVETQELELLRERVKQLEEEKK